MLFLLYLFVCHYVFEVEIVNQKLHPAILRNTNFIFLIDNLYSLFFSIRINFFQIGKTTEKLSGNS